MSDMGPLRFAGGAVSDPGPFASASDALDWLFEHGQINLERDRILSEPSGQPTQGASGVDLADRVAGMLFGLAIGDSLGNRSESRTPAERRRQFGEITSYLPHPAANGERVGLPSDDTQLAFRTVEHLLTHRRIQPDHFARDLATGRIYGMGQTVREFCARIASGMPWYASGPPSAGNGALMRIAPVILPHLRSSSSELRAEAALAAMITHNDPTSTGSCVAFASMLRELTRMDRPPEAEWWISRFVEALRPLEGKTQLQSRVPGNRYVGSLWQLLEGEVAPAVAGSKSTLSLCDRWYSGAYLLETVPAVLVILSRHAHDPHEAILRAVNDTRDNDTVAAIVGAAVGALHGATAFPADWKSGLLGRTTENDDGRVFELIDQALVKFVLPRGFTGRYEYGS